MPREPNPHGAVNYTSCIQVRSEKAKVLNFHFKKSTFTSWAISEIPPTYVMKNHHWQKKKEKKKTNKPKQTKPSIKLTKQLSCNQYYKEIDKASPTFLDDLFIGFFDRVPGLYIILWQWRWHTESHFTSWPEGNFNFSICMPERNTNKHHWTFKHSYLINVNILAKSWPWSRKKHFTCFNPTTSDLFLKKGLV